MDLVGLTILFLLVALTSYIMGAKGVAWFSMEIVNFLVWAFIILAILTLISRIIL